ncbi:DUF4197 domain-containing protein [soil metagenome]
MKKLISAGIFLAFLITNAQAQLLNNILNKVNKPGSSLSTADIAEGLRQALQTGTDRSVQTLSVTDGFFANATVKILMPEEAKKVEQKLRAVGLGEQVDQTILSMNRAAEDAAKTAAPIFLNAIKQINFQDAAGILRGGDFAATEFLKNKTSAELSFAFKPIIEASLNKFNVNQYWNTLFITYNKFSFNKVNPDLQAYVTEKALTGIFYQIGLEEQKIRKDPAARTTDLVKQVFK